MECESATSVRMFRAASARALERVAELEAEGRRRAARRLRSEVERCTAIVDGASPSCGSGRPCCSDTVSSSL